MKKRIAVIALATAALLATSAAATAKPSGHKLGGVLKVVAWEGYTENQWVKPFEKQTGCTVQHQYAGSSDEMYNLMKKNAGYDLVSASGDASNRLIASGLVQPIDPSKIPNWKQLTPQLRTGANQYVGGKNYGVPWQWGPNVLMWNTAKYKGVTNSWSALYDPKNKGMITIPNNPIQIADAALYLSKTTPSLGIKDPYELTSKQLDAAVALLKQQRPLIKVVLGLRDRRGQELPDRRGHARRRLAAGGRTAPACGHEGRAVAAEGRRDRLVGRLDAGQEPQEPRLRAGLAQVLRRRQGAGAGGEVQHLHAGQPALVQGARQEALRGTARGRRLRLPEPRQVLEDAAQRLRQRQERLHAVLHVGLEVDVDQGLIDGR